MSLMAYDDAGLPSTIAALLRSGEQWLQIAGYNVVNDSLKVGSVTQKFREGFPGSTVDLTKWDVTNNGMTATVSDGNLTVATGVTANASYELLSKQTFRLPLRVQFAISMSQRIANQDVYLELVSVNATTGVVDNLNAAAWRLNGTVVTQGIYEVQGQGQTRASSAASTIPTTASASILEFEAGDDETWFYTRAIDSMAGRVQSYVRNSQTPDPNARYKLRLRVVNGASAPASTTNVILAFVAALDYAELTTEITGGRGQPVAAQAIPVVGTGGAIALSGSSIARGTFGGIPVLAATGYAANPAAITAGRALDLMATLIGALVTKPYAIPESDWTYSGPLAGLSTEADTAVQAAAGAGIRRYVTAMQLQNNSATPTEFQIKDGSTVIWKTLLAANQELTDVEFPTPLRTTANAALNVRAVTAASVVILNMQGYTAP